MKCCIKDRIYLGTLKICKSELLPVEIQKGVHGSQENIKRRQL